MPTQLIDLHNFRQWKTSSAVPKAFRISDPVLHTIDKLMRAYAKAGPQRQTHLLFRLYFATLHWLRNFEHEPRMKSGRENGVRRLFRSVAVELAERHRCGVQALPNILEEYYGRELSTHGYRLDHSGNADYLSDTEREPYRVFIRSGKFYGADAQGMIVLFNTNVIFAEDKSKGVKNGWANFIMTMGGSFFSTAHVITEGRGMKYHSSYTEGQPVMFGGSWLIHQGVLAGIQNNSGHYRPTDSHTASALRYMQMAGVNLRNVLVHNYKSVLAGKAPAFLAANGSWDRIIARREALQVNRSEIRELRQGARDIVDRLGRGESLKSIVDARFKEKAASGNFMAYSGVWDEVVRDAIGMGREDLDDQVGTKMNEMGPSYELPSYSYSF